MSLQRIAKLAAAWQREARDDHRAADRLAGVEQKLARVRANTREALANQLTREVERIGNKEP